MPTPSCPVHASILAIGGKWKPCILYRLQNGTFRFSELRRQMPWISEKVLIRQLKELEKDGIVVRTDYGEVPPRVDYALSDYGATVGPLMETMAAWGEQHLKQPRRRDAE
ncbi:winged helix-turn-helix transcriptional regulator [Jannaschia sp. CCS1]|uniref:winged helix-turn-helix transcriptional regulator n=1 Tax=Jannaschia sp. (strain CCS1) TaxID=290400 RepID=UPI000053B69C|nr:helix-turn-helix domain-containing protein [Jannaschia sp. CCS1]ABD56401.1 transcriptional regulator, MarR family [Jannaschia sp. CCS1]